MRLVNWNCNGFFLLHAVSLSNSKCHRAKELKHSIKIRHMARRERVSSHLNFYQGGFGLTLDALY